MESPTTKQPATAAEPKRPAGINGRVVLHAVRRRPLTFAGAFGLAAVAAAVVWFFLPLPKETAAVVFHIASQTPSVLDPTSNSQVDFASYKASQAALVKRRLTLNAALKEPGISGLQVIRTAEPDPLSWLDRKLTVDSRTGSEFMRVSIEGDNGEELRLLLDAVAKAYLADVDERDNGQRRRRLAKLIEVHKSYQEEVTKSQKAIDSIAAALSTKDGPTLIALDSVLREDLRVATRERSAIVDERQLAEGELAGLDAVLGKPGEAAAKPAPVPEAAIEDAFRRDPVMRDLEVNVAKARQNLVDIEKLLDARPDHPWIVEARDRLKTAEQKRNKYRDDNRAAIEDEYRNGLRQATELRRDELRRTISKLAAKAELADARVKEVQNQIKRSGEYRLDLENHKRNIEQTEKLSENFSAQIERLKIELNAPVRVTLSEEAFVVPGIEGNRRLKYTLMVGIGVLIAGFAGLVGWEYRSRRVTHTDEVTADLGLRLLGTVPPLSRNAGGARPEVPPALLVEAIDTTRTMLLHGGRPGTPLRTLVVTSATAQEGKTSLAGHLAISLARAGFRTVLIDADFQNPTANRLYDLPPDHGLCEVLRGETDVESAVRGCPVPGLSVLPAGRWDLAVRQALVGDRWRQTKRELETRFDFLVIDTAPLLLVSDTLLLAREADGTVLSVLFGVSQVSQVAETVDRLQAIGAKVTGAVVNGVWNKAYRVAYGYGASQAGGKPEFESVAHAQDVSSNG